MGSLIEELGRRVTFPVSVAAGRPGMHLRSRHSGVISFARRPIAPTCASMGREPGM